MTVVNIRYTEDRIDILTDTLTYAFGRPVCLCASKTEISENGAFAWAGRGFCWMTDRFDALACTCEDVDHAELAAVVWGNSIADAEIDDDKGAELYVAGWSPRLGALTVRRYARNPGEGLQIEALDYGIHLAPTNANIPPMPATVTDAQFKRLALAQWKIQDQLGQGLCIGGVQHWTTLTEHGAAQRIAGTFPDYETHAAEFGDPNADAVAAFFGQQVAAA